MKLFTAAILASASIVAVAGCAATRPQLSANGATSGTYYCWQERLADQGSNLVCNWNHSEGDACHEKDLVSLPKASVSDVQRKVHRCDNGQWLATVTTR